MKNFTVHDTNYTRIIKKNNTTLIKYSPVEKQGWLILQSKNIKFINTPRKIKELTPEEKIHFKYTKSKIELPYLQNYETLGHNKELNNLTTKQLLLLIQKITQKIKQMHKANIYHTDIHSENIMINKQDIKLIDLDAMLIENYISPENVFIEDNLTFQEQQNKSQEEDKQSILNLLLYYLKKGTFQDQMNDYIDLYNLNLPKDIKQEISAYQQKRIIPKQEYYYEDILEELLRQKYESPKLITRK